MSFWEKNSELLRLHYEGLLDEITADDDNLLPAELKIETASTGDFSLCIKGIYVHSPRDPLREARRLAETVAAGSPVVILGFGLGYTAEAVAGLGRCVIVVEKYKKLLYKAMELRDLSVVLSKKNIIFVLGGSGEGITNALAIAADLIAVENTEDSLKDCKSGPPIIRNRALIDIDKEWYGAVEERIRTWVMKDSVNTATLNRFGRRWIRNLSHNMSAIRDCPGISRLAGLASFSVDSGSAGAEPPADGAFLPVFLAAAGPSLDKTASLLNEIYRRCIVVAVDTSLRFLVKNGVQPDFVLTVDPQFWNSRHLDRCVSEHTILIAESAVYPPALRLPFKKTFLCGSLFPMGAYVENQVDPKGRLGAGGSVATTALDFCLSLGGQEIWIAGLDLAFPNQQTHFRGALFEERSNTASNRFNPAETGAVRALRDGFPFKAASAVGGQVLTDRRLFLYAAWFENHFRLYSKVKKFGIFQNGLAIAGLEPADMKRFLALPDRRDEINRRLKEVLSETKINFDDPEQVRNRAERYEKAVTGLINALKSIQNAAENGAAVVRQALYRNISSKQQEKILRDLDEIMRCITASEVKEVAGFLFPPIKEPTDTGDPFRAYLTSSLEFFSSLADAVEFNLGSIHKRAL